MGQLDSEIVRSLKLLTSLRKLKEYLSDVFNGATLETYLTHSNTYYHSNTNISNNFRNQVPSYIRNSKIEGRLNKNKKFEPIPSPLNFGFLLSGIE